MTKCMCVLLPRRLLSHCGDPLTELLFDPVSGVILGAQAVGKEGVDKRIDMIATAMRGRNDSAGPGKAGAVLCASLLLGKRPRQYGGIYGLQRVKGDLRQIFIET